MKTFTKTGTEIQEIGGKFKRQVVIKYFQTEDGLKHEFTTYENEDLCSGAVIALTPDNQVIVSHEFRPAPERWMFELPGGSIKPGEDPKIGAMRELREETGYVPGEVEFLGKLGSRDAYINGALYYYLATNCRLSDGGQELDKTESDQGAEVKLISISQLIENAKTNQMTDPVAVLLALDFLSEQLVGKT